MNFIQKLSGEQQVELKEAIKQEREDIRFVRRVQAILFVEQKVSEQTILIMTGYKREVAVKVRSLYLREVLEALHSKRKKKAKSLLSRQTKNQIVLTLNKHSPREFGHEDDLWTTIG